MHRHNVKLFFTFIFVFTILLFYSTTVALGNNGLKLKSSYMLSSSIQKPIFSRYDWEDDDWDDDWDNDDWKYGKRGSFDVRYNRVESLYLGTRLKRDYWRTRHPQRTFLYGFWGYSFGVKTFEGQLGLEKGIFDDFRFAFGGEYHKTVDTPDRWIIPDEENSLAAFFLREDFQDFYLKEGGSAYLSQNFTENLVISATYHYDELDSLKRNTSWSLFGGKKKFVENPAMSAGDVKSVVGRLIFDTRNSKRRTTRGWYIQVEGEYAGEDLKGDYDFSRMMIDLRRYQPIGYGDGLDIRIRAGTAKGDIPWQKSFHLGGLSTLRGFRYKTFPNGRMQPGGNRMLLAQIEYRIGRQDLPDEIDLGLFEHFYFILFSDFGWVSKVDPELSMSEGFDHLQYSHFKNDVGVALSNRRGNVRFEVARRTDTGEKPYTMWFRINRSF